MKGLDLSHRSGKESVNVVSEINLVVTGSASFFVLWRVMFVGLKYEFMIYFEIVFMALDSLW